MAVPNKKNQDNLSKMGAVWDGRGTHFRVFSSTADKIEVCLFDTDGKTERQRIELKKGKDDIWHAYVPDVKIGQLYGYRASGLNIPEQGYIFNSENILLDPYAKEVVKFDNDSLILGRVSASSYDWEGIKRPEISWNDTIIYEMHIKGFTKNMEDIPENERGKFSALKNPKVIEYLQDLGITSVELLPIHAFINEEHLQEKSKSNYWGYNSVNFFSPNPDYLETGSIDEIKDAVKALHKAGIEVILDVVYNHTAEGGKEGPIISFKGLDNHTYYRLVENDKSEYINETGCGNTLNISNPATRKMVIDSLRYWAEEFKIDGFRFDLAVSLGRNPEFFDEAADFFQEIEADPILSKVKLIAEPWDIGPDGYKLGGFPEGWHEWNDRYRDDIRSFWRGDFGKIGEIAKRISASSDIFDSKGRSATSSINFITAHDGFTLHDLVTYNDKHNEANGEENRDGHSHNLSNNYGVEGETDDEDINAIRTRQKKNLLTTLFLSHGTPMLLAGDEFGNSQKGNNNAYCQDNDIGWLNWDKITNNDKKLQSFVKQIIKIRKENPILSQKDFLHGKKLDAYGVKDITWFRPSGREKKTKHWNVPHAQCLGVMFNNAAATENKKDERLLVIFNASSQKIDFKLPAVEGGNTWERVIDTVEDHNNMAKITKQAGEKYPVSDKSIVVFKQKISKPPIYSRRRNKNIAKKYKK